MLTTKAAGESGPSLVLSASGGSSASITRCLTVVLQNSNPRTTQVGRAGDSLQVAGKESGFLPRFAVKRPVHRNSGLVTETKPGTLERSTQQSATSRVVLELQSLLLPILI